MVAGHVASLRLVAIADTLRDGLEELVVRAAAAVACGATSVQLRLVGEDASTLLGASRALVRALPVPVVVHERADVAVAAGAAGVHLSREEVPASAARRLLRPGMIVGTSASDEREMAVATSADYVSVGPIFPTEARLGVAEAIGLEGIARLVRVSNVPVVAVGGVTAGNARVILDTGAVGVAVIIGAFAKAESENAIRALRVAIET